MRLTRASQFLSATQSVHAYWTEPGSLRTSLWIRRRDLSLHLGVPSYLSPAFKEGHPQVSSRQLAVTASTGIFPLFSWCVPFIRCTLGLQFWSAQTAPFVESATRKPLWFVIQIINCNDKKYKKLGKKKVNTRRNMWRVSHMISSKMLKVTGFPYLALKPGELKQCLQWVIISSLNSWLGSRSFVLQDSNGFVLISLRFLTFLTFLKLPKPAANALNLHSKYCCR